MSGACSWGAAEQQWDAAPGFCLGHHLCHHDNFSNDEYLQFRLCLVSFQGQQERSVKGHLRDIPAPFQNTDPDNTALRVVLETRLRAALALQSVLRCRLMQHAPSIACGVHTAACTPRLVMSGHHHSWTLLGSSQTQYSTGHARGWRQHCSSAGLVPHVLP
jgi:hypothetical protein